MSQKSTINGPLGWDYPIINGLLYELDGRRLARIAGAFKGNIIIERKK